MVIAVPEAFEVEEPDAETDRSAEAEKLLSESIMPDRPWPERGGLEATVGEAFATTALLFPFYRCPGESASAAAGGRSASASTMSPLIVTGTEVAPALAG